MKRETTMDVQEVERESTRASGGVPNDGSTNPSPSVERFQALLTVSESIASCRDPEELFRRLVGQLKTVIPFDLLGLVLLQQDRGVTSLRVIDTTSMVLTPLPELPMDEDPAGWVIETQQPLIVPDTAAETRWPRAMEGIRRRKVVSFCTLPLTTARRRVGALGLASRLPVAYTPADVGFLCEVAKLVSVAVDNVLTFDDTQAMQAQVSAERDHLQLLLDVTNAVASNLALPDLVTAVSSALRRAIPHAFTSRGATRSCCMRLPSAQPTGTRTGTTIRGDGCR